MFVYVDSVLQVFPKEPTSIPGWSSPLSPIEKNKNKKELMVLGGQYMEATVSWLSEESIYFIYIHREERRRGQRGMFLEREDEGGERELGRKLRILNEKDGENDQGKTWFYLLVPRFPCHCEFVSKAASTSVLCCSRPASSWQYEMAIEFYRGHGRLQLLVRTMKNRSTLQYHLPFCYPPEMTVIKYLCVNNFSYCFLLFIILQHYVRYFVFLPPLV